jgi:hypothetical protein
VKLYAGQLREELAAAIDTTKLAEAWRALHPKDVTKSAPPGTALSGGRGSSLLAPRPAGPDQRDRARTPLVAEDHATKAISHPKDLTKADGAGCRRGMDASFNERSANVGTRAVSPDMPRDALQHRPHGEATKAISPVLSVFLDRAWTAISGVLKRILPRLYAEGWVLGQQAAAALTAATGVDWGDWTPGDWEAAEAIAGAGLRELLDDAGIQIKSIADSRVEELADVLEATLASVETKRPPLPEPLPPMLSVGDLARQLEDVLDNPGRAELVAQAEIGRAQAEAARKVYAEQGVAEVEISTAEDGKVCPICDAAAQVGAHPVGTPPMVLLHPRCRCAELPVLAGAS